jgi:MoaA/NifB/PqqE/SkfB family radical SAM enzyme
VTIGINCVIQRANHRQLGQMLDLATQLNVDFVQFKLPHGSDPRRRYVPTVDEWQEVQEWIHRADPPQGGPATNLAEISHLLHGVLDLQDLAMGWPMGSAYRSRGLHCFVPLFFLVCDARGDVYPCDYLHADTRPRTPDYIGMRDTFRIGNIFTDGDLVLDRLAAMLAEDIRYLPGLGNPECGSCTRFFALNEAANLALAFPDTATLSTQSMINAAGGGFL